MCGLSRQVVFHGSGLSRPVALYLLGYLEADDSDDSGLVDLDLLHDSLING